VQLGDEAEKESENAIVIERRSGSKSGPAVFKALVGRIDDRKVQQPFLEYDKC
jgi:hypothetical protein